MDSILITGANGLVGQAILARLSSSARVYALLRNKPTVSIPGNVTAIAHDLCKPCHPELPETPTAVLHLAQSPCYRDFPQKAQDVFDVNVASTQRLLDWACHNGVRRFIYASSGGLYGSSTTAFTEESSVEGCSTLGHYFVSKRCAELLCESYRDKFTVIILRPFFIYGPHQRQTMLMPRLVRSVLNEWPIHLQGEDGMQLNPVFVNDAAAAFEAAMELDQSQTINVAGPQVLSMREIGMLIGKALGREPLFEMQPNVPARHLIGSIDKMSRLLGPPRTKFSEGIRLMITTEQVGLGGAGASSD